MPWCEPCEAFYNPNSLAADGTCPSCGAKVTEGDLVVGHDHGAQAHEDATRKVPWHFWVAVAAMVIYLGWRLIEGIIWLF